MCKDLLVRSSEGGANTERTANSPLRRTICNEQVTVAFSLSQTREQILIMDDNAQLLAFVGQSIVSGCPASQVDQSLGDIPDVNATIPGRPYECTLLMLIAARPEDDDESVRIAEVLQKHGADVNWTAAIGSTPLVFAADKGKSKFLRWLIQQGARIDQRLRTSPSPPIYMSCQSNQPECVAILGRAALEQGKEWTLDARSRDGFTPAYIAFMRAFVECLGALSMCGADLRQGFSLYWCPAGHPPKENAPEVDPNPDMQPQASLMQAMLSFTTLQCAHCKNISSTDLNCCGRCHMVSDNEGNWTLMGANRRVWICCSSIYLHLQSSNVSDFYPPPRLTTVRRNARKRTGRFTNFAARNFGRAKTWSTVRITLGPCRHQVMSNMDSKYRLLVTTSTQERTTPRGRFGSTMLGHVERLTGVAIPPSLKSSWRICCT